jgi:hypothetical protein
VLPITEHRKLGTTPTEEAQNNFDYEVFNPTDRGRNAKSPAGQQFWTPRAGAMNLDEVPYLHLITQ